MKAQGATFEFEFETTNVYNDDAVICRICGNDNFAPGIVIYASGAELVISREIVTGDGENAGYNKKVSTKYKAEESNRISFVITPDSNEEGYRNRILSIYVNGELCGAYAYDKYTLTNGNIYQVAGGTNISSVIGIIVADSNNNVIYSSKTTPAPSSATLQKLLFRANKENLYLYVSYETSTSVYYRLNFHQVYVLDKIFLNDNFNFTANLIYTFENAYGSIAGRMNENPGSTARVYNMQKGRSYTVTAENYLSVSGLLITDYDLVTNIFSSSTTSTAERTSFTYTWTASQDGLIIVSTYDSNSPYSITINENILDEKVLVNKTISCEGDSIMRGNENSGTSYYNLIYTN